MQHPDIQVDIFEVQLGAAVLTQFRLKTGELVRVLADAGIDAPDYPLEHVHDKLSEAFRNFDSTDYSNRLDLIVGSHYDADHLDGLVPIIEDKSISIGEIWLPPVANDRYGGVWSLPTTHQESLTEGRSVESPFIAHQFADDRGYEFLCDYLQYKASICEEMSTAAGELIELFRRRDQPPPFRLERRESIQPTVEMFREKSEQDLIVAYFQDHYEKAQAALRDVGGWVESMRTLKDVDTWIRFKYLLYKFFILFPHRIVDSDLEHAKNILRETLKLLAATAKEGIRAISLYKVVKAVKARQIPIRCYIVQDGQPQRFYWQISPRRFIPTKEGKEDDLRITLLGPSRGLVEKHRNRLPHVHYLDLSVRNRIPIETISPSNQLSYVLRICHRDQGILIVGDAGCVDFRRNPWLREYHKPLLDTLLPLHVIQVAHHGGHNADFYNVLLEGGYAEQTSRSFLTLSHATHDRTRPTPLFEQFVHQVRRSGDYIRILFTSEPTYDKVFKYKELFYPPTQAIKDCGDIRLAYQLNNWMVVKHAVAYRRPKEGSRKRQ